MGIIHLNSMSNPWDKYYVSPLSSGVITTVRRGYDVTVEYIRDNFYAHLPFGSTLSATADLDVGNGVIGCCNTATYNLKVDYTYPNADPEKVKYHETIHLLHPYWTESEVLQYASLMGLDPF